MKTENNFATVSDTKQELPIADDASHIIIESETSNFGAEKTGEIIMTTFGESVIKTEIPTFRDHPIFLWLAQKARKIQQKPYLQEVVLDQVMVQEMADENLLGIILFGSLALGTHTWKSDIDLIFIYESCEPETGLVNRFVDGVEVQYFFVTLAALRRNLETVPYLLHIFCNAKILFDRHGTIVPVVNEIEQYFSDHPEVEAEWVRLKDLHQVEKRGSACQQTTIMQRWDELEDKYSGGVHKRTFFRS